MIYTNRLSYMKFIHNASYMFFTEQYFSTGFTKKHYFLSNMILIHIPIE